MEKKALSSLLLMLMVVFNLTGENCKALDPSDTDDFITIECTLRPIERKSHSPYQQLAHAPMLQESTDSTSVNWSGYAAITGTSAQPNPTYDSVTEVSGSWKVPTLIPNVNGDTFSSAWVGIDGYVSPTVEQIGTNHFVINGEPVYEAWFSLYPAATQLIDGFPVSPGDIIEGRVVYRGQDFSGNGIFCLTIKNRTQNVKFSTTQHTLPGQPAHLSSAEWIVEAPGIVDPRIPCINLAFLPLANFNTIPFYQCEAKINGLEGGIDNRHWTFDAITMVSNSIIKAIPSALSRGGDDSCRSSCHSSKSSKSKGNNFDVIWESPGPFPFQVYCPPIVP